MFRPTASFHTRAAIVLVSDGADTSDASLSSALLGLKAEKLPVFTVGVGSEKLRTTFASAFGIDAGRPEFATNADRVRNREQVIEEVERAFAGYDAEPLLARLNDAGIPAVKVRTLDEVYAWEQVHSQGLVIDVDHQILGNVSLPGPPLRFFSTADTAETTLKTHTAPPLLDQDGEQIRQWLGLVPADASASAGEGR